MPRSALAAAAASLLLAVGRATPAAAHELGTVQVRAELLRNGSYDVALVIDTEQARSPAEEHHYPAAAQALAAATPRDRARLESFLGALLEQSALVFDGVDRRPATVDIEPFADVLWSIHLRGEIPPGARTLQWRNSLRIGAYLVAFHNEGDAAVFREWLDNDKTLSLPFAVGKQVVPMTRGEVVRRYLALGFHHIVPEGADHILFVLGIFLLSRRLKEVLWQVTAFTVAHTITLGLTIYGVVSVSPRIVEPAIALSILYVAVENVLRAELKPSRVALVFGFGLLHGMGFAGVLREVGLPRSEFLSGLLSFNVGVEGGQLAVIATAYVLLGLPFGKRPWYRRRVVVPLSLAIAAVGLYWAVQRIFFL
jgi:hydrogenase/urease accessory protein HupE